MSGQKIGPDSILVIRYPKRWPNIPMIYRRTFFLTFDDNPKLHLGSPAGHMISGSVVLSSLPDMGLGGRRIKYMSFCHEADFVQVTFHRDVNPHHFVALEPQ